MLNKVDIYEEICSGWNKDSRDIKNTEIQVITKKLRPVEASRQNRHNTGNHKKWVYDKVLFRLSDLKETCRVRLHLRVDIKNVENGVLMQKLWHSEDVAVWGHDTWHKP